MLSESTGSEACCLQDLPARGLAVRSRPLGEPVPGKEDRLWKAVAPVATGVPRPQDFSISIVYRWALYPKSVSRLCGCHPQSCYFLCLSLG